MATATGSFQSLSNRSYRVSQGLGVAPITRDDEFAWLCLRKPLGRRIRATGVFLLGLEAGRGEAGEAEYGVALRGALSW